ncbi:DUF1129 family protein [Companilactobacillus hulinensis]|uniref:DUF1129 family protein n=1 Tax=Companilactobacillus hulinensis TaxID=2486007 RepID=UPI000F7A439A|nr:DUF1129 family protein [Companilactobacillus hulinensis]
MAEDLREKNKQAAEKQKGNAAKKVKHQETKEKIATATPDELRKKLSNKNEEYVFRLNRFLVDGGFTEDEAKQSIDELMSEIIENQIKGITANTLYGPVTKKATEIVHPTKPKKATPFWASAIDTSLLFFALFGLLYGIVAFTSKKTDPNNQTGILTLLILSAMWGSLLTWFNNQMKKPKNERPGWGITIGYLVFGLILMFLFLGAMAFVPTSINPTLGGIGYFIVAAIAYGIRFVYRRYMGIHDRAFF